MSIAIFRHLKLYVALPLGYEATVLNFHPRRLLGLYLDQETDGSWLVRVFFTHLQRRRELLLHYDEVWHLKLGQFTTHRQTRRSQHLFHRHTSVLPAALTTVWTENATAQSVYDQFEDEVSGQVAVERYLHQHTPNPYDFKIVIVDFDPKVAIQGRPQYSAVLVRPPAAVEMAAKIDRSESSEQWAQLFFE